MFVFLDLLSVVELEKKASDIKAELEKALEENALLQKQVNELPEFQSLPNSVEMQQREINKKNSGKNQFFLELGFLIFSL